MGNLSSHNWPSQRKRKREEEESAEGASTSSSKRAKEESAEGASTSSSISPEATSVGSDQSGVFLSFRGPDTRKEFTDHLYHSLEQVGIVPFEVFKDDKCIPVGEEFPKQIFDAIEQSKISIPIISKNYASSKWCLRELIRIMDRKKSSSSHTVLPIFYKIAPSDVRRLNINSGWAFPFRWSQKRFNEEVSQKGRQALEEVSRLQGWESSKFANGHEGELIRCVVKTVWSKLQQDFKLDIPMELVGLDGPLMKIMNWIRIPSVNARMIGIYAMGGMGKTTLAKYIYSQLKSEFKHASLLLNIGSAATKPHGIVKLQSRLINDLLQPHEKIKVYTSDVGISIIKSSFKRKKILVILDDIDSQDQLDALAGEHNWFMPDSLIIVTTRNKTLLNQSPFQVHYKYELEGLDEVHSMLLFESHAFREDPPRQDFKSISRDIISTLGGLPLALKIVGRSLYKKDRKLWEDTVRQLQKEPRKEVEDILRISYEALTDEHKQIFLEIACFFIDEPSEFAMCVWESYGFIPSLGIEELRSRCLIDIEDEGFLEMHDQLRDLGRKIFCEGQPLKNRSRPWDVDYEGVPKILRNDQYERFDDLMLAASSGDEDLSEVIWLEWTVRTDDECDVYLSTTNLHLPKLVVLKLAGSDITEDWGGWRSLRASKQLRVLDLTYCSNLRSTPDLSAFTHLKFLILDYCRKLEHLPPSIGELTKLVSLQLAYCEKLKELPEEVGELRDLEKLVLQRSGITEIPTSICSLGRLEILDAKYCKSLRGIPRSIGDLQNLQYLGFCDSGIEELPGAIGSLKNLATLDISGAPISHVPESIRNLSFLLEFKLEDCDKLRSLPELPSSLKYLSVPGQSLRLPQLSSLIHLKGLRLREDIPTLSSRLLKLDGFGYLETFRIACCSSIETLDLSELIHLTSLAVFQCNNLVKIQGLDNLKFLEEIFIGSCNSIKSLLCQKSWCLKKLSVHSCDNLVEIQGPLDGAKFLEWLCIEICKSLEALPDLTGCEKLRSLYVRDCKKLTQLRGTEKLNLNFWDISGCDSLQAIPKLSGIRWPKKL